MNGAFTTLKNKIISNSGRGTKDIKHLYYSEVIWLENKIGNSACHKYFDILQQIKKK